jgi:hypothetical protein
LLRYNTEDVVRPVAMPLTCSLRNRSVATSDLLGKLRLAVRHEDGWTFPRDLLEALEAIDEVPLPARCGFWEVPGGVAVEVVTRGGDSPLARRVIGDQLEARQVPVRELYLREHAGELQQPLPLRCDLRETSFRGHIVEPVPGETLLGTSAHP